MSEVKPQPLVTFDNDPSNNKEVEEMGESTEGMVDSTSKLQAKIKALTGFDVMTDENTYKSTYEITKGLASAYATMNDIDRAALLELVAGEHLCRNV